VSGSVEQVLGFADNYLPTAHNLNEWSEQAIRAK
jgi:hypothetical protein